MGDPDVTVSLFMGGSGRKAADWTGTLAEFVEGNPELIPGDGAVDERIGKLRDGWSWTFGGGAEAEVYVMPHHVLDALVRKHTAWRGAADMIDDAFRSFPCRICRGSGRAHDVTCEGCEGAGRLKNTYRPTLLCHGRKGPEAMELTAIADHYDAVMKAQGDPRRAYRGGGL